MLSFSFENYSTIVLIVAVSVSVVLLQHLEFVTFLVPRRGYSSYIIHRIECKLSVVMSVICNQKFSHDGWKPLEKLKGCENGSSRHCPHKDIGSDPICTVYCCHLLRWYIIIASKGESKLVKFETKI